MYIWFLIGMLAAVVLVLIGRRLIWGSTPAEPTSKRRNFDLVELEFHNIWIVSSLGFCSVSGKIKIRADVTEQLLEQLREMLPDLLVLRREALHRASLMRDSEQLTLIVQEAILPKLFVHARKYYPELEEGQVDVQLIVHNLVDRRVFFVLEDQRSRFGTPIRAKEWLELRKIDQIFEAIDECDYRPLARYLQNLIDESSSVTRKRELMSMLVPINRLIETIESGSKLLLERVQVLNDLLTDPDHGDLPGVLAEQQLQQVSEAAEALASGNLMPLSKLVLWWVSTVAPADKQDEWRAIGELLDRQARLSAA